MKSHGYAEFSWRNTTLYVHAFGPFNAEGIDEVEVQYLSKLECVKHKQFKIIEIWDDETLAGPESIAKVGNLWQTLLPENCIAIAVVVSNAVQLSLCEKHLPIIGKAFTDVSSAEAWIKQN